MKKILELFNKSIYANICGSVLAIGAVFAKVFGYINNYWVFITIALYVIGFIIGQMLFADKVSEDFVLENKEEKFKSLDSNINKITKLMLENKNYFDTESIDKITSLCSKSKTLINLMQKNKGIVKSEDIMLSEKIILEYLPSLMTEYFEIPVEYINSKKTSDKKSALDLFKENIDTILNHVENNLSALVEDNTKDLMVQSKFLKSKIEEKQHFEALM